MTVTKQIECPQCENDIDIDIDLYVDGDDVCCEDPGVVECHVCGQNVDVNVYININVEANI